MPLQGRLSLVATPIGNLEDMTFRALATLRQADLILAEDTRHTLKLLNHFEIHAPLNSLHKDNEYQRIPDILDQIRQGKRIALVSDAGTPGISDPGYALIQALIQADLKLEVIPGASAVLTALLGSGLPTARFFFCGFLEHKASVRRRQLTELQRLAETLVFFVAPHHLSETLEDLQKIFGDRQAALCRELTKMHEEYVRGPLSFLRQQAEEKSLGEYTVVVAGNADPGPDPQAAVESLEEQVKRLAGEGLTINQAIARTSRERGIPRAEVYSRIHVINKKEN